MKDIVIRKVKTEDAEQYIKLRNLVWKDAYKSIFPNEVFIAKDARADTEIKDFDKVYYNDTKVITYVAVVDNKIIGLLWGKIESEYEYFKNLGYADLMAMYIHPDFQGLGIATKFKNIFINWAKENGATNIVIGVLKDNIKARKVYEKWGGKLSIYTNQFVQLGKEYEEVFYTYKLNILKS